MEKDSAGLVLAKYLYGTGIDEPIKMTRTSVSYFLQDGLGSTVQLAGTDGQLQESYHYDVFGRPTIKDSNGTILPNSSFGNRYLFTGRELDQETNLYHYRARTYHPTLGRFGQRDSWTRGPDDIRLIQLGTILFTPTGPLSNFSREIGKLKIEKDFYSTFLESFQQNPLFLHPYLYVQNNPVTFVDPTGHEKLPAGDEDQCFNDCQQFCIDYLMAGDMEGWRRCFETCVAQWN